MPSSRKSDGSTKTSTKITKAGDTVSLSSTETTEIIAESISNRSEEPTVVLSNDLETDTEENVDAELGTPLYMSIYAFFHPVPNVDYDNGRKFHEFTCSAKGCQKKIRRYLDTKDAKSTSNLRKHAKLCWGMDTINAADQTKNASEARSLVNSHRQHTKTETKFVLHIE